MAQGRLPGSVIGQVFRPGTSTPRAFPRYAAFAAKGLDLKLFRDVEVTRAAVVAETVPFSGTTYIAPLANSAVPDKQRSRLYTSEGRLIGVTRWNFSESTPASNVFDQLVIDPTIFNAGDTYQFDYVSNNPALTDEVPVDELRETIALGDNAGQVKYREGIDYRFLTTATGPTPDVANLNPTLKAVTAVVDDGANTGTGTLTHNSSTYTHSYNRTYVAEVTAASGITPNRLATIRIDVYPTSSGSADLPGRSVAMENSISIDLDEAVPATLTDIAVEHGITLDFAFGGTHFVVTDVYTFDGNGPGLMELADPMLNTNQFEEVTAVTADVLTGDGDLTINPQSVYTGPRNQRYEVKCTAIGGVTPNRTANFQYRTNGALEALSGTVTATNASATVAGVSSEFAAEVVAGDFLFIGVDPRPVEVLSVTNSTTLVLTAAYPFTTQAGVKILRVREQTGAIAVTEGSESRVTMENGIFLDFDFGATNFAIDDEFSFTARVARNEFNGKENRNYDFTVTDTTTNDHEVILSYSGSTPLSGFGSHTFSEGNPLVLSNNLVIHARNVSLANRFDAIIPADAFDLSLTFDGLIDWALEASETETVASSDVLRDLTGSVTGTVGAYFILLDKVPTTINYVRGPSPTYTNLTFNQVAGTTIVYFLTDPAVTLTIDYMYEGAEPEPGATYFMTGYTKRPDTDYERGQLFFTKDAARDFLAPMTPANDAAIANEIAWEQDEASLPGVVVFLVRDSDGDGIYTTSDYKTAISVSESFKGTMDMVVVNQYAARATFRDSVINMNDPTVARRRIGYFGFPTNYPIGDTFTADSRVYAARRELQVFEESVARGTLAVIGNSYAKKTISVQPLGNSDTLSSVPTQVTLDGSFLAVALAARVASFNEPWQTIYNVSVSGFDEIESLTEQQMIQLQDAGIIAIRVEGESGFYQGTMTTDETEASTQQLSGTVQRHYVLSRLQDVINRRVIGFVADSPEEAAQALSGEIIAELGSMVSEGKIGQYIEESTGTSRPLSPSSDVVAFRDRRDPTKAYFRASWYQKYPILYVDGLVAVDSPTP